MYINAFINVGFYARGCKWLATVHVAIVVTVCI